MKFRTQRTLKESVSLAPLCNDTVYSGKNTLLLFKVHFEGFILNNDSTELTLPLRELSLTLRENSPWPSKSTLPDSPRELSLTLRECSPWPSESVFFNLAILHPKMSSEHWGHPVLLIFWGISPSTSNAQIGQTTVDFNKAQQQSVVWYNNLFQ